MAMADLARDALGPRNFKRFREVFRFQVAIERDY